MYWEYWKIQANFWFFFDAKIKSYSLRLVFRPYILKLKSQAMCGLQETFPNLYLLVSKWGSISRPGGEGMAAPGETNCSASVYHKYKLNCKTKLWRSQGFWADPSNGRKAPYHRLHVAGLLMPRGEAMPWLTSQRKVNTTTGKNYKLLRAALKANCPPNEGSSEQGLCNPMCCGRLVNPAVWQQNRILFQVFLSTTMTDTNAPAGRKPTINQDSLEFGGNFSRTRNAEVSVSPEHSSRTKIYYFI